MGAGASAKKQVDESIPARPTASSVDRLSAFASSDDKLQKSSPRTPRRSHAADGPGPSAAASTDRNPTPQSPRKLYIRTEAAAQEDSTRSGGRAEGAGGSQEADRYSELYRQQIRSGCVSATLYIMLLQV